MADFTIKGSNGDDVAAALRAKLEANDAQFNAQLDAIFQPAAAPAKPAAQPQAAKPDAAKPGAPKEWTSLSRKPDGGGSMLSRLRS